MKVPLSWLREYVETPDDVNAISELLTMAGLEVDAVEAVKPSFSGVVVARVEEAEKHPEADRLKVATVFDGRERYQVVCGAPNCEKGLISAFAPIGAEIGLDQKKPFKISEVSLRGVQSFGMLCSEKELGLSEEHEGIVAFDDSFALGTDLAKSFDDHIFEISLTPNLGHCLSVRGVARELAAVLGVKCAPLSKRLQDFQLIEQAAPIEEEVELKVEAVEDCPAYAARLVKGIKVGASPDWMKRRLELSGIRSINNIVDSTNYCLHELGHPLHAFDRNKMAGGQVQVRHARDEERLSTLDGLERILTSESLVIADCDKAVAIAGIMGGANSEVTSETKDVLLESAQFRPGSVRKTSKALGLMTEASRHFERGTSPLGVDESLDCVTAMIAGLGGGKVCRGVLKHEPKPFEALTVDCRLSRVEEILGLQIPASEVESIFLSLEMDVDWKAQDTLAVTIPAYRNDITAEIDLIEEVARIHGYQRFQRAEVRAPASNIPHTPMYVFERMLRSRMITEGLQELWTCSLISPKMNRILKGPLFPQDRVVHVQNPTSSDQSVMRASMLPGLLDVLARNIAQNVKNVAAFEIGRVYFSQEDHFEEVPVLGIVLSGNRQPHHFDVTSEEFDFLDMKGVIENLADQLGIAGIRVENQGLADFHPGRQASIFVQDVKLGVMGEVHPAILRAMDIDQRAVFCEIDLRDLSRLSKEQWQMRPLAQYPSSDRDWTVTLPDQIPVEDLLRAVGRMNSKLLETVSLLDIYRSNKLGADKKNVTLRFVYRHAKKTLSQEAVDREHARIVEKVQEGVLT